MKLLNRKQIENLSKFKDHHLLTTSFYLDTDKSRLSKKEINVSSKNLLRQAKSRLEHMDLNKEQRESLTKDLDKIKKFSSRSLPSYNFSGLAVFSCHHKNFWQELNLPEPPRNRTVFDQNPYLRPLSALIEEYKKICTLVFDRREAKWYKIFAGDITLLETMEEDVPSKVKEGGWEGYESKRIERHIATHLREYFKNIAKKTFRLFKKNSYEWLILGAQEEYSSEFDPLLHPYLKDRLQGWLHLKPNDSPNKVLQNSLELEKQLLKKEEKKLTHHFISELKRDELAVSGLKETLKSLNRGELQTLFVMRNYSSPGRTCPHCQLLFVDEAVCPSCGEKTEPLVDVIDEAIEAAWDKSSQVKQMGSPSELDQYGKIGGLLRYKAR
ncbi:hypothetical protein KGY73_01470 [bacterium]|nr:hypothetical protein [bacterium]